MSSPDYLPKDAILPENQNFCCLSLFMNDDKKTIKCLKVSGAFKDIEDAKEQIQLLKEQRGHYNFVAEIGAWNAFDPLPNENDLNDELNAMMHRYLINVHRNNLDFEKRKYGMLAKNIEENGQVKINELEQEEKNLVELDNEIKVLQENVLVDDEEYTKTVESKTKAKEEKLEYIEKLKVQIKNFETKKDENLLKEKEFSDKINNIKVEPLVINKRPDASENQNKPITFDGVVKRKNDKIENQNWYCVSFLVEENKTLVGLKISGCFNTNEEADNHSRALRDINDNYSILLGELYKWQPFNPSPDSVEAGESEYANPQLNDTMKSKRENEKKAQLYHEFRKNDMIRKNLEDSLNDKQTEKEEIMKKLENISNDEIKKSVANEISTLDEQIKKLESKKQEYVEKETELSEKIGLYELQRKMDEMKMKGMGGSLEV
jgi:DNA repair exonuclease SbcCD ATPase subunit